MSETHFYILPVFGWRLMPIVSHALKSSVVQSDQMADEALRDFISFAPVLMSFSYAF